MAFFSINSIKEANRRAGYHFFSEDTLRFFKSRVMSEVFPLPDGALFVTSERQEGFPRQYTIRRAYHSGNIETLGGFRAYNSRNGALKAAKRAAEAIKSEN